MEADIEYYTNIAVTKLNVDRLIWISIVVYITCYFIN